LSVHSFRTYFKSMDNPTKGTENPTDSLTSNGVPSSASPPATAPVVPIALKNEAQRHMLANAFKGSVHHAISVDGRKPSILKLTKRTDSTPTPDAGGAEHSSTNNNIDGVTDNGNINEYMSQQRTHVENPSFERKSSGFRNKFLENVASQGGGGVSSSVSGLHSRLGGMLNSVIMQQSDSAESFPTTDDMNSSTFIGEEQERQYTNSLNAGDDVPRPALAPAPAPAPALKTQETALSHEQHLQEVSRHPQPIAFHAHTQQSLSRADLLLRGETQWLAAHPQAPRWRELQQRVTDALSEEGRQQQETEVDTADRFLQSAVLDGAAHINNLLGGADNGKERLVVKLTFALLDEVLDEQIALACAGVLHSGQLAWGVLSKSLAKSLANANSSLGMEGSGSRCDCVCVCVCLCGACVVTWVV
jgi:hypothetical protein